MITNYVINISSPSEVVSVCCEPTSGTDPLHHPRGRALFAVGSVHLANVRYSDGSSSNEENRLKGEGFRCSTSTVRDRAQTSDVLTQFDYHLSKDVSYQVPSVPEAV